MAVVIKRIYENNSKEDGKRVLVDRIWPRGISKEQAALDDWVKEAAPSSELRKWFNHDKEKYELFAKKYKNELQSNNKSKEAYNELVNLAFCGKVTLLYASKNETYNHAVLLRDWINDDIRKKQTKREV
ncbi:DUF488 domain-containing protein [Alteribacillus sp. JSM 102045]|uniref:DUF488 domain-containing protein n=1 Tax=Alteribacillus sp. JSM 102045 TaxID=1562101 RepID=UPI0035BF9CD6